MSALLMVVNIVEIVILLAAFASGIAVATLVGMSQVSTLLKWKSEKPLEKSEISLEKKAPAEWRIF